MIFSNPENTQRLKAVLDTVKFNKKGNLVLQMSDPEKPDAEPGFITLKPSEMRKIYGALEDKFGA